MNTLTDMHNKMNEHIETKSGGPGRPGRLGRPGGPARPGIPGGL